MLFDALKFFKDHRIRYWTEGKNVSPGWVNIKCLFCINDSNHLGWNLDEGYFHCWKCNGHKLHTVVSKLLRVPKSRAEEIILEYSGHVPHRKFLNRKKAQAKHIKLPGSELNKFHRQYLKRRKFDPDYIIKKYKITGTGPKETWEDLLYELRIIIPIMYNRKLVSFQARDITDKQKLRYKGCPIEKSVIYYKDILYNWDNANQFRIVVVEGITDVWRLGDGFVASFGTGMTQSQIKLLSTVDEIFFLFDPGKEAQNKAKEYAELLASIGRKTEIIKLQGSQDPGELSEDNASYIRRQLF